MSTPPFDFGIFDFDEFANWLADRHGRWADWLLSTAAASQNEMAEDDSLADAYEGVELSVAINMAYLAMLSSAISYSIRETLLDGTSASAAQTIEEEPFHRARFMLTLHANRLPVRNDSEPSDGEPSILDQRAAIVAGVLVPVSIAGFDAPSPMVQETVGQMAAPVREAWQAHEFADEPLCQMMALSFWLGFRTLAGNETRRWHRVLDDFWNGWINHLLNVDYALQEEDLEANEKLE